tara:strand:+ start:695 stop:913 length:219 start_codon:yes stop_codon:yes gene_type:complete
MARELHVKRLVITKLDGGKNHAHFEYDVKDGDLGKSAMHNESNLDLSKSVNQILADFEGSKGTEENIPSKKK